MDTIQPPVAEEKKAFPFGLILDLLLITVDFALGWIWPQLMPINADPARPFWPGILPLLGIAALLYIVGLWLYRQPLAMLDEKTLQDAKFRTSIKPAKLPILVLSVRGRKVARASFDVFSLIGFGAILLVALVGDIFYLVNSEMLLNNIIVAVLVFIGISALAVTVLVVFGSIGKGTSQKSIGRPVILSAALLQLPMLLCLMGVVSAIVGNTAPPPMVQPNFVEIIVQIPLFALLFCFLSYVLLFTPRRLLSLPLRGSLSNWKFWGLLLISYGIRLGLERYAK